MPSPISGNERGYESCQDGLRIAVIGAGQFSQCFIPLLQAHPLAGEVSLCEVLPDRLQAEADRLAIRRRYSTFDEVLASKDVDAVAIFTQRWMHAPMALAALRSGKHVYSAVPAATTLDEMAELVEAVKVSGLTYMMGETSMYYGATVFCREKWQRGEFGRFVYGEGEYYHDMSHGFYEAYKFTGGGEWKRTASFPPMLYPTHSLAMVLSVTGSKATKVSCLGYLDEHPDGIFRKDLSCWENEWSNQSALFRTSDGGILRINEFRRVGVGVGRSVRTSIYGTEGAFEEQSSGAVWTNRGKELVDVESSIRCRDVGLEEMQKIRVDPALRAEFSAGFATVHEPLRSRLPASYQECPNGHEGSHQFLIDDFVTACVSGRVPTVSVWDAARFNAPGIVAHESAKREGELLDVPDFGDAPAR